MRRASIRMCSWKPKELQQTKINIHQNTVVGGLTFNCKTSTRMFSSKLTCHWKKFSYGKYSILDQISMYTYIVGSLNTENCEKCEGQKKNRLIKFIYQSMILIASLYVQCTWHIQYINILANKHEKSSVTNLRNSKLVTFIYTWRENEFPFRRFFHHLRAFLQLHW